MILLIVLITIFSFFRGDLGNKDYSKGAFIFTLLLIFCIGLRPINIPGVGVYFGDTINYYRSFEFIANGGHYEAWSDPIFGLLTEFCARYISAQAYFFILAALYILPIYFACRRINFNQTFILLLGIVTSMLFFSGGVNGIRAGIGSSFVLLAFTFRDKKILLAILFILAIGFHKSMILPIMAFIISSIYANYKVYLVIWFISIVLSLLLSGFWENFFASFLIGDERFSDYLTSTEDQNLFRYVGFRWDFLFYSAIPVFTGYFYINKSNYKGSSYIHLFNTYLIANSFWILVIRASYSNRFAALSWFLLPLILIVPLIDDDLWFKNSDKISISFLVISAFTYYASYSSLWG